MGKFFDAKEFPQTPEESPAGGFRCAPLAAPLNDQRRATAVAPLWKLPTAVLLKKKTLCPHYVADRGFVL